MTIFTATAIRRPNFYVQFFVTEQPERISSYAQIDNIVTIKFIIADNQSIPNKIERLLSDSYDYWGWFDEKEQRFTHIFHERFLLELCFRNMTMLETSSQGKAYRLLIL